MSTATPMRARMLNPLPGAKPMPNNNIRAFARPKNQRPLSTVPYGNKNAGKPGSQVNQQLGPMKQQVRSRESAAN